MHRVGTGVETGPIHRPLCRPRRSAVRFRGTDSMILHLGAFLEHVKHRVKFGFDDGDEICGYAFVPACRRGNSAPQMTIFRVKSKSKSNRCWMRLGVDMSIGQPCVRRVAMGFPQLLICVSDCRETFVVRGGRTRVERNATWYDVDVQRKR